MTADLLKSLHGRSNFRVKEKLGTIRIDADIQEFNPVVCGVRAAGFGHDAGQP